VRRRSENPASRATTSLRRSSPACAPRPSPTSCDSEFFLGDPQFGLKFGAQYEPRHAGVVGNTALAARTVGEAFEMIGRYLPTMIDGTVHGVKVSDGIVFVYSYYIDPLMMSYRQKGDWAIAFACNLMRVGLGDPHWPPEEVLLPQLVDETPAERRTRAEIMGDNIRAGHPWAGIRFDASLLKRPMATADAMMENLMRHYGDLRLAALPEQRGEIEQLRREIARVLVKGEGGIEHLAKANGISVRTLQRRLKDAGLNYSDLQNDSADYPYQSMQQARAFLDQLPASKSDIERIAHGNPERLLKL
jgi:hypothetical protein